MEQPASLTRLVLRNVRSIGQCDIALGPLTWLIGPNGAGKSNVIYALGFLADALGSSLGQALRARGGVAEVRRRSKGHPNHFGIRLDFTVNGRPGHYAFDIGEVRDQGFEVLTEECSLGGRGKGPYFRIQRGQVEASSEAAFPALTSDRLALVAASGLSAFRPVFDALTRLGVYNLSPSAMRELQVPQEGRLLQYEGANIASVIGHLEKIHPAALATIQEYLSLVVPTVHKVRRIAVGHMETLEFRQDVPGAGSRWRFNAASMSDGTLRALGILTAIFQANRDFSPTLIGIEEPETALHPAAAAALRAALQQASASTQIIVTSHSPDLLDDPSVKEDQLLAVISVDGETRIGPIDAASRQVIRDGLFSAGELLRLGQLEPDTDALQVQQDQQAVLFDDTGEP